MKGSKAISLLIAPASAFTGALLALILLGKSGGEHQFLQSQSDRFHQLTDEEKRNLWLSYRDFISQTATRQQQLRDIHSAVLRDPRLENTLRHFGDWWKQLSRSDWDTWLTLNEENRLGFVKTRWADVGVRRTGSDIEIRFAEAYARRLPRLRLTTQECLILISAMLPEQDRSEEVRVDLNNLKSDGHKALRLNLCLFEQMQPPPQLAKTADRIYSLKSILLNEIGDSEWKAAFQKAIRPVEGRTWEVGWLTPIVYSIFSQSAMKLGNDLLREFPVNEEQMLEEFEQINADQQRAIMTMSPAQAKARLEFLAQTDSANGPEQQLLRRYAEFAGHRDQLTRTASFGLGTASGNPQSGRGGQPPAGRSNTFPQ
jgi:hypothetical protein